MRALLIAFLSFLPFLPALAEESVVLGLSQDKVSITTRFDGSNLLIFGAIKREAPMPEGPLDVIVTLAGPTQAITVRRKERRFGIWVNAEAVPMSQAPAFYAVATTAPLPEILSNVDDLRHTITIPRAIRAVGATSVAPDVENFIDALVRIRMNKGQYQVLEGAVRLDEDTLFRTEITLPSALTEGVYPTRIFLLRNGAVVARHDAVINVQKEGIERSLFEMSREQPLLYGILSLVIAVAAGWGASAFFRMIRQA